MPTYEYKCGKCNVDFELVQKMTEEPIKKCPRCKSTKVRRLFSAGGGIIFKGSGFYSTDYRSENYKKREKEEKGAPSSKCDSCPSKTDNCK